MSLSLLGSKKVAIFTIYNAHLCFKLIKNFFMLNFYYKLIQINFNCTFLYSNQF